MGAVQAVGDAEKAGENRDGSLVSGGQGGEMAVALFGQGLAVITGNGTDQESVAIVEGEEG